MYLEQDLAAIWERIVRVGQIRSSFVDVQGRRVESGIRMGAQGPEHYAIDLDSSEEIGLRTLERPLEGSDFHLLLNPFRVLKPRTHVLGLGRQPDTSAQVEDCFFACQDPGHALSLLRRNIQLIAFFRHYQWAGVHNLLPVEQKGHFLWIPVNTHGVTMTYPHLAQVLTLPLLEDFLEFAARGRGLMTFFNAMHAGGSVNHIHYHSVYRGYRMPIEEAKTEVRGTRVFLKDFAAAGLVHSDGEPTAKLWQAVSKLQDRGIPINLIHSGERTFLFGRHIQHEVVEEFPSGVLAGMELAGRPITTETSFYREATWEVIAAALRKSTLTTEELVSVIDA